MMTVTTAPTKPFFPEWLWLEYIDPRSGAHRVEVDSIKKAMNHVHQLKLLTGWRIVRQSDNTVIRDNGYQEALDKFLVKCNTSIIRYFRGLS